MMMASLAARRGGDSVFVRGRRPKGSLSEVVATTSSALEEVSAIHPKWAG